MGGRGGELSDDPPVYWRDVGLVRGAWCLPIPGLVGIGPPAHFLKWGGGSFCGLECCTTPTAL